MAVPVAGLGLAAGGGTSSSPVPSMSVSGASPPTLPVPDWLPLPEWLVANPYFTAGFGLGGIATALGVLRQSSSSLQMLLRRQMLMSLEIPSKDYAYQWVLQYLVANRVYGARHIGVETTYTKDAAGHQAAFFDFVPSTGNHWMRYKGMPIQVSRERAERTMDMSTGTPWETLTLTTFALRPSLFHDLLTEAKLAALGKEEGKTMIYQCYGHEWRPFGSPKYIRPFDSVVLDGDAAEKILGDVQEFLNSQVWYLDRGIPYRRGYLLHGPPGCGKSSFVAALAGRMGYGICVLNLGDPSMTDDRLQHLLAVVPPRSLVLLEDVDFAVGDSAPPDPSGPYAGVMRISFSGLLNALDGVVATEERIVFMTTNHYRRLPRALVRPGRVDLSIFIGLASSQQLRRMFLRFFPGNEALAEQFATICADEGMSMAELQGYFMFFKEKPEEAMANVGPYLEARREAHQEQQEPGAEKKVQKQSEHPSSQSQQPAQEESSAAP